MEDERVVAARLADLVRAGTYSLGSGDTELSRVFAWRFWHLLRSGGRMGVVVPRQQTLAAPGMLEWRRVILEEGAFEDVTLLENRANWAFDDMEPRYTIGLIVARRGGNGKHVLLRGPYRSAPEYQAGLQAHYEPIPATEFAQWSEGYLFPTLTAPTDADVFRQLMRYPKLGEERPDWTFRPVRDFDSTNDKHLFDFSGEDPKATWPVYAGESLEIWEPDTGKYYAYVDPSVATGRLQEKRLRQARTRSSAFYGLPDEVVSDPATLPCRRARIAWRKVSRASDSRTLRVALVPPNVVLQDGAPYLFGREATERDEAFVLGLLSSRIVDWVARKFVELNVTFTLLNMLPLPVLAADHAGRIRVTELAGRLAAVDERFADWATVVGVDYGPVEASHAEAMRAELEACVARLYGLDEQQVRDLYASFHPTWDHEPWTEKVLEHYRKITWDPAEVPA